MTLTLSSIQTTDAISLAARTRGPSWGRSGFMGDDQDCLVGSGGRSAARLSQKTFRNLIVPARHRHRGPEPRLVSEILWTYRQGRPEARRHPIHKWMAATLDGVVEQTGAVFEAKFMLTWAFTEEGAAEKHKAQLQHDMWVTAARSSVRSIVTGAENGSCPVQYRDWRRPRSSICRPPINGRSWQPRIFGPEIAREHETTPE
ncbi:hypothetical protein ACVWXO_011138 [Bradyrhizobium sp. LM2.7]